jgi:hypothetical protein
MYRVRGFITVHPQSCIVSQSRGSDKRSRLLRASRRAVSYHRMSGPRDERSSLQFPPLSRRWSRSDQHVQYTRLKGPSPEEIVKHGNQVYKTDEHERKKDKYRVGSYQTGLKGLRVRELYQSDKESLSHRLRPGNPQHRSPQMSDFSQRDRASICEFR